MPVKSAKQMRFMYSAADGKAKGILPSVAKEFIDKTPDSTKHNFGKAFRGIKDKGRGKR